MRGPLLRVSLTTCPSPWSVVRRSCSCRPRGTPPSGQAIPTLRHRTWPSPRRMLRAWVSTRDRRASPAVSAHALCDLALEVGADSPTLCTGWTAKDLVVHLLVRERSPLGAAGIMVAPAVGLTDRASARYDAHGVRRARRAAALARRPLRDPGRSTRLANTFEYVVHHEDLRRGVPGWEPRQLDPADLDALWAQLAQGGRARRAQAARCRPWSARADTGDDGRRQEGRAGRTEPGHDHRRRRRADPLPLRPRRRPRA